MNSGLSTQGLTRKTTLERTSGRMLTVLRFTPAAVILLVTCFGPLLAPYDPRKVVATPQLAPDASHWFGTDSSGFDVYSRVLAGSQVDVALGLCAVFVATAVGAALGLFIGMNEAHQSPVGTIARTASRLLDLMQAIPAIVIAMVIISFFGTNIGTLVVALAVVLAPTQARLVRTETLRVRSEAYLDAARMGGLKERTLIFRHVLPNASWPALENSTVIFGSAVFLVAALGFLGVGLHPPTPEWGSMIALGAADAAVGRWWSFLFPALATILTVTSVAGLGHSLFGTSNGRRKKRSPRPAGKQGPQ